MCDCEELRDDKKADIIQLWEKNTSWVQKHSLCDNAH